MKTPQTRTLGLPLRLVVGQEEDATASRADGGLVRAAVKVAIRSLREARRR